MIANSKKYYQSLITLVAQRSILFASYLLWTVLFANTYGAVGNKDFNLQITTYGFFLIVCGLSMETGFTYAAQRYQQKHSLIINSALATAIIAGLVAMLLCVVFASSMQQYFNIGLKPWHAFAYVFAWLFTGTCQYIFQIKKKMLLFNVAIALLNLALIAMLYAMPTMKDITFYGNVHFGFLLVQGVVLFLLFLGFNKDKGSATFLNKEYFNKVLKYSVTVFATNLVTFFMFRIDYFVLEHFYNINTEALKPAQNQLNGNYNLASRLVQIVLTVTVIIAQVLFPDFALEKDKMLSYARTNEIAKYVFIGFFSSCVLIAFSSKYVFPFLFGKGFNTMYKDFFYLIPGLIAQGVSGCFSAFLMGINKVKVVLQGCIIALIVILIGDIIFIPKYGTLAAALVSSLGYTVQCFYSIYIIEEKKLYQ